MDCLRNTYHGVASLRAVRKRGVQTNDHWTNERDRPATPDAGICRWRQQYRLPDSAHRRAVAERDGSLEVIWRVGTIGRVEALADGQITLDLGYRTLTIPYLDERPTDERATPPSVGERVLLRGKAVEQSPIMDTCHDGELAHLDRLRARVAQSLAKRNEQAA
jgi:hypothetical protein